MNEEEEFNYIKGLVRLGLLSPVDLIVGLQEHVEERLQRIENHLNLPPMPKDKDDAFTGKPIC